MSIRHANRQAAHAAAHTVSRHDDPRSSTESGQTLINFAELGMPGVVAITSAQDKGNISRNGAKFLLVGEFFGTTEGQDLERHLSIAGQGGISIRLDHLAGHNQEEKATHLRELITDLKKEGYVTPDTEIYITPHGSSGDGRLDICTTGHEFSIDAIELLEILGRGKHDPPSHSAVHVAVCESKPLHKTVQDYPHDFLFYSGSHSIWTDSTTEVLKLQLNFSARQHHQATSAKSLFDYAGKHAGSDLTLSGNGKVARLRISPKVRLTSETRIAQLGRHIRYKFAHGSFQAILRLFKRFGIDNLKKFIPEMDNLIIDAYLSEKENHYKLALLLLLGFDPNAVDSQGQTAVHKACHFGDDHGVKFLLTNGASADIKDKDGKTARDIAKSRGFDDIITTLDDAKSGKTFSLVDKEYVLFHLCDIGEQAIASLAASQCTKFEISDTRKNTLLLYAIKKRQTDVARTLLHAGAPIDAINTLGNSALHLICTARAPAELIREIRLQYGDDANMNAQNHRGFTPLMYAARHGLLHHANRLMGYKADVNSQSYKGNTALHMAVFRRDREMVTALLNGGANKNVQNHRRHTPMDIAQSRGLTDIIHLLTNYPTHQGYDSRQ